MDYDVYTPSVQGTLPSSRRRRILSGATCVTEFVAGFVVVTMAALVRSARPPRWMCGVSHGLVLALTAAVFRGATGSPILLLSDVMFGVRVWTDALLVVPQLIGAFLAGIYVRYGAVRDLTVVFPAALPSPPGVAAVFFTDLACVCFVALVHGAALSFGARSVVAESNARRKRSDLVDIAECGQSDAHHRLGAWTPILMSAFAFALADQASADGYVDAWPLIAASAAAFVSIPHAIIRCIAAAVAIILVKLVALVGTTTGWVSLPTEW